MSFLPLVCAGGKRGRRPAAARSAALRPGSVESIIGGSPSISSYAIIAKLKTSTLSPYGSSLYTSGAMYCSEPVPPVMHENSSSSIRRPPPPRRGRAPPGPDAGPGAPPPPRSGADAAAAAPAALCA